ncbi:MAG: phosphoribosyltransferase [Chloroflexi bacterium]|nr:phosphoribosyltransferase [Chloroflexota bacterium]
MWYVLPPSFERFLDRSDAGQRLAARLQAYAGRADVLTLGLPRGGVAIAAEIAAGLGVPLDVLVVRKLGVPGHDELAMGALTAGGRVLNDSVVAALGISDAVIAQVVAREQSEIARRERAYRAGLPPLDVRAKTVIVADDGLATGATMRAALMALRAQRPARLIVAVPVASPDACDQVRPLCDDLLCLHTPGDLHAIGLWYNDFSQLDDGAVIRIIETARHASASER